MSRAGSQPYLIRTAAIALAAGLALGAGLTLWLRPLPPAVIITEPAPPPPVAPSAPPPAARYAHTDVTVLPGWREDNLTDVRSALALSCAKIGGDNSNIGPAAISRPGAAWRVSCDELAAAGEDPGPLRAALERNFDAYAVSFDGNERGTFTGYYEASLKGALTKSARYNVPLYGLPDDLVTVPVKAFVPPGTALGAVPPTLIGRVADSAAAAPGQQGSAKQLTPYYDRAAIDGADAVADKAPVVAWIDDPVDAHILHIQGSGQVTLPDGSMMRVGFAGSNGRAFTGIGSILLKEGVLKPGEASMIGVRNWLRANPKQARELMQRNARYIFFRRIDGPGPIGAQGVPLTPLRSLAVDPAFVPLGAPVWLDTADPDGQPLRRLMVAQDVGAAITGAVRGDVFWGAGDGAFAKAARMKSPGRFFVLVPKAERASPPQPAAPSGGAQSGGAP